MDEIVKVGLIPGNLGQRSENKLLEKRILQHSTHSAYETAISLVLWANKYLSDAKVCCSDWSYSRPTWHQWWQQSIADLWLQLREGGIWSQLPTAVYWIISIHRIVVCLWREMWAQRASLCVHECESFLRATSLKRASGDITALLESTCKHTFSVSSVSICLTLSLIALFYTFLSPHSPITAFYVTHLLAIKLRCLVFHSHCCGNIQT